MHENVIIKIKDKLFIIIFNIIWEFNCIFNKIYQNYLKILKIKKKK